MVGEFPAPSGRVGSNARSPRRLRVALAGPKMCETTFCSEPKNARYSAKPPSDSSLARRQKEFPTIEGPADSPRTRRGSAIFEPTNSAVANIPTEKNALHYPIRQFDKTILQRHCCFLFHLSRLFSRKEATSCPGILMLSEAAAAPPRSAFARRHPVSIQF